MPKISVIVPVYKVEKYLHECVDSILAQTCSDFELILVDDGSPDSCGKICDEYAEKDPRVLVIHQENQGVSAARNTALDVAKGEFIAFVDSDDYVSKYYLEILMQAMQKDANITFCRHQRFEDGAAPQAFDETRKIHYETLDSVSAVLALHDGSRGFLVSPWGKLFRATTIGHVRFPEGRIHEDQVFIPIVCYQAKQITACDAVLYFYRQRTGGITNNTFSPKRFDDIWAIDYCITYFESRQEATIVEVLREKRQYRLAAYTIYAWRDKVKVPREFRVGILNAVRYMYQNASAEYFEYYLGQIHPKLALNYRRLKKIRKFLKLDK